MSRSNRRRRSSNIAVSDERLVWNLHRSRIKEAINKLFLAAGFHSFDNRASSRTPVAIAFSAGDLNGKFEVHGSNETLVLQVKFEFELIHPADEAGVEARDEGFVGWKRDGNVKVSDEESSAFVVFAWGWDGRAGGEARVAVRVLLRLVRGPFVGCHACHAA